MEKSLDLKERDAEAVMHIVAEWAQLARAESRAGRLVGRAVLERLMIAERVVGEWAALGGKTGFQPGISVIEKAPV